MPASVTATQPPQVQPRTSKPIRTFSPDMGTRNGVAVSVLAGTDAEVKVGASGAGTVPTADPHAVRNNTGKIKNRRFMIFAFLQPLFDLDNLEAARKLRQHFHLTIPSMQSPKPNSKGTHLSKSRRPSHYVV